MRPLLAGALLASALSGGAWAYGVDDPGATGCELFAKLYERGSKGTEYQFFSWTLGYVAGLGRATQEQSGRLEPSKTMHKLVAYCSAHPKDSFRAAVDDLLKETGG